MIAAVLHLHEGARQAALKALDEMRRHRLDRHDVGDGDLRPAAAPDRTQRGRRSHASARSLSSLPTTRSTSSMAANMPACVCAAQPVTTMRAAGRSRFSRRIDCRAWATASLVTAQVLTMTVSSRPALSARRRMISDSDAFSRQPKVMTSTLMMRVRRRWQTAPDRSGSHIRARPGRSSAHDRRSRAIRSASRRRAA